MELDLTERDPDFVKLAREFIFHLRKIEDIIPFERCWTPPQHTLIGFVTSLDGGCPGFGCTIHAERNSETKTEGTEAEGEKHTDEIGIRKKAEEKRAKDLSSCGLESENEDKNKTGDKMIETNPEEGAKNEDLFLLDQKQKWSKEMKKKKRA